MCGGRDPAEGIRGSIWFLCNRYTPYPNLYPDQSPSEDWTMEERFRPLTFHGLVLRSQLVTLLVRGVCYSESQSVSLGPWCHGRQEGNRDRPCCSGRGGSVFVVCARLLLSSILGLISLLLCVSPQARREVRAS